MWERRAVWPDYCTRCDGMTPHRLVYVVYVCVGCLKRSWEERLKSRGE